MLLLVVSFQELLPHITTTSTLTTYHIRHLIIVSFNRIRTRNSHFWHLHVTARVSIAALSTSIPPTAHTTVIKPRYTVLALPAVLRRTIASQQPQSSRTARFLRHENAQLYCRGSIIEDEFSIERSPITFVLVRKSKETLLRQTQLPETDHQNVCITTAVRHGAIVKAPS